MLLAAAVVRAVRVVAVAIIGAVAAQFHNGLLPLRDKAIRHRDKNVRRV
jgi:hypothetical protein